MQKVTEVGKWDVILQVEQCLFFVHLSPWAFSKNGGKPTVLHPLATKEEDVLVLEWGAIFLSVCAGRWNTHSRVSSGKRSRRGAGNLDDCLPPPGEKGIFVISPRSKGGPPRPVGAWVMAEFTVRWSIAWGTQAASAGSWRELLVFIWTVRCYLKSGFVSENETAGATFGG